MKLLSFDELPESYDPGRALVSIAAFREFRHRRTIDLWQRQKDRLAEYGGVFAVDRGIVVGQAFVERIPYTFPHGTEVVSGIAGVTTRLDHARAGVARRVLEEVHRRERAAGIRYATLWTNRSWGAHRLYEQLGYRDIYTPPIAVRIFPPRRRRSLGTRVRDGKRSDLREIENLHARSGEGRLGFAQRPRGFARLAAATGDLRPETVLLALERGRAVGYAIHRTDANGTSCGELVATSPSTRTLLASSLEGRARSGVVTFWGGAVNDLGPELRRRGYVVASAMWWELMATELGRERSRRELVREFGTNDPRFRCLSGDSF
ncbi:MAG: GNAT family N-acetyltransferase [Thermoplasmata archaeon]|jgi:GNAT superfamily N-acetyltransferase